MIHLKTLITAFMASFVLLPAKAQDCSPKMAEYKAGCQNMLDGIANKDKYALYAAKEDFNKVSIETIEPKCKEGTQAEGKAKILFCTEFADSLIKHNFIANDLDDIAIMRNTDDSDLLVFHRSIAAKSTLCYEWEGSDRCELLLVTQNGENITVTVTDKSSGKQHTAKPDAKGNMNYVSWDMGTAEGTYSIRIENPTPRPISFAIALN